MLAYVKSQVIATRHCYAVNIVTLELLQFTINDDVFTPKIKIPVKQAITVLFYPSILYHSTAHDNGVTICIVGFKAMKQNIYQRCVHKSFHFC